MPIKPYIPGADQAKDASQRFLQATYAVSVTPSDSVDINAGFDNGGYNLLIGVAGNVRVTTLAGQTLVLPLQAGFSPILVTRVWSTSTTATGIFAVR